MKKIGIILFTIVIITLLILVIASPQETQEFKYINGDSIEKSIAEIKTVRINDVDQRLLIRGKDRSNPLLLHIHGGPGSPDSPLLKRRGHNLEDIFTVCYWDQRGAGASYSNDLSTDSMSLRKIVEDGIEITKYLLVSLEKEKLYIEAHSWGTAVGIHMIRKRPKLYQAYFGIGQMANSKKSEQLSYDFTWKEAKRKNDQNVMDQLNEIGRPPYNSSSDWIRKCMRERKLSKTYLPPNYTENISMFNQYKDFVFYPEYSIADKLSALKGDSFSMENLWQEAIDLNLFDESTEYEVPIYFFQGVHDKITVTSIVKEYFEEINAPVKKYFNFENSGHYPHLDEFEKYKSIIQDLVEDKSEQKQHSY